jgi:hypothetical protein
VPVRKRKSKDAILDHCGIESTNGAKPRASTKGFRKQLYRRAKRNCKVIHSAVAVQLLNISLMWRDPAQAIENLGVADWYAIYG